VKDVLTWHSHVADPPAGTPLPHPPRDGQRAVLLEQHGGERVLPIWIGEPEAEALALALTGKSAGRPLSADLTARLLEVGDLVVERVVIETVRDFTFYATIVVVRDGGAHELDARPSDALNLALRVGAPVLVSAELIEQAGAAPAQVPVAGARWRPPPDIGGEPAEPIGEWRSALAEAISEEAG
jgi:bifunctional DNase/RNase